MIQSAGQVTTIFLLAIFLFLLVLAGLLVLLAVILLIRRQRNEKERDRAWERMQTVVHVPEAEDHTLDKWAPGRGAFGFLTVLHSDDRSKVGLHFDLTEPCTTLGRSKDNDISFPKDSPVSRHHAKIVVNKDGVYLSEVISVDGVGPRFGTFNNQTRVMSDPVLLKSGDIVELGKRLRLKFQSTPLHKVSDEKTYIAFASHPVDADKTSVHYEPSRSDQPVTKNTDA